MRPGRWRRLALDLWACFLIPAYTLLYAGNTQWLSTNFSVLACLSRERYFGCLYWGLLLGSYFLVTLLSIIAGLKGRRPLRVLTVLACLLLGAGLIPPYLPRLQPRMARMHVALTFSACVLMMLVLLGVVLEDAREGRKGWKGHALCWLIIAAGSAVLFGVSGMVTGALEIWFAVTNALLVRRLWLCRRE